MGIFTPTAEGLAKGKLVDPAVWYPVEVSKVEDLQSKTDGSDYTKVTLTIIDGQFKGVNLFCNFSAKWQEAVVPFIAAVTGKTDIPAFEKEIVGQQIALNEKTFKGRKLEVYVTRGKYKDPKTSKEREQNSVDGYRPYGKVA